LVEGLIAAAAAGGSAVVQAAGTDACNGTRGGLARLFGRGETARVHGRNWSVWTRPERCSTPWERVRRRSGCRLHRLPGGRRVWSRFLEDLPVAEQQQMVVELRALIAQAEAARAAQSVHNDVARATFTNSQVLGSGSMTVTNNYDR